jgi:broad specificity phosphatase PhoE
MSFQPPNGEALIQVERRASKWLEDNILFNDDMLDEIFAANQVGITPNIAIFSHGMTIKCLLHYVMGFDKNFTWRISILNTSVTKLHFDQNGWAVDFINNTSHLDKQ